MVWVCAQLLCSSFVSAAVQCSAVLCGVVLSCLATLLWAILARVAVPPASGIVFFLQLISRPTVCVSACCELCTV